MRRYNGVISDRIGSHLWMLMSTMVMMSGVSRIWIIGALAWIYVHNLIDRRASYSSQLNIDFVSGSKGLINSCLWTSLSTRLSHYTSTIPIISTRAIVRVHKRGVYQTLLTLRRIYVQLEAVPCDKVIATAAQLSQIKKDPHECTW